MARARERASQAAKERRESKIRAKAAELDTAESTPDFSDDPIVVVEQSESDEEKLESNVPGVVFVRRKRAKPKVNEMDHLYYRMFGFNGSL